MTEKRLLEINLVVGNDNGNSEHDLIINGSVIQQANVLAKTREMPLQDEINPDFVAKNIHDHLLTTIASPSASPGIYFVGNYALRSDKSVRSIEVGVANNKLNSEIVLINTISQIAGFAVKQAHELGNNLSDIEIIAKVDMTTALPVTQYSKTNANFFADRFLKDKHTVIVHVGVINVHVSVVFEYVKVLPESVPAVFALQHMTHISSGDSELTEDAKNHNMLVEELFAPLGENIDGYYFKKKRILHVSIGEGTTEYPLTNGIDFDTNFIRGSNNGIGHAIEKSLKEFKRKTNLLNYSRQQYSTLLKDQSHKYSGIAHEIISDYLVEESNEILKCVKNEIELANNEIDIIVVYGGGSILMHEYLNAELQNVALKADIVLFYVTEKFSVTLEAKGMYEFSLSNIFKQLKTNYLS